MKNRFLRSIFRQTHGFSYQLALQLLVIVTVMGLGSFLLTQSHAASLDGANPDLGTAIPILISSYDVGLHQTRYFAINSDGSKLTELSYKNSTGTLIRLPNTFFFGNPSKYFSKVIGWDSVGTTYQTWQANLGIYDFSSKTYTTQPIVPGITLGQIMTPVYSPNGKSIAFMFQRGTTNINEIDTVTPAANPDGTTNYGANFTTIRPNATSYPYNLRWQPTIGSKLTYFTVDNTIGEHLHIVNLSDATDIDLGRVNSPVAAWSYDGSKLAFVGVDYKIHLYFPATGKSTTLANPTPVWDALSFSPDNTWLLYQTNNIAIGKVNTSTGQTATILPRLATNCVYSPTWLNNGLVIYDDCGSTLGKVIIRSVTSGNIKNVFAPWNNLLAPVIIRPTL